MRLATGAISEDIPTPESEGKDPAAVALGWKVEARERTWL
jgi:hypothetical protein